MVTLTEKWGEGIQTNDDSTEKHDLIQTEKFCVMNRYNFLVFFCHYGKGCRAYTEETDKAKRGSWANADIGCQSEEGGLVIADIG